MSASAKASRAYLVIRSMKKGSTSVLLFCVYKDCEARKGRCEAKKQPGAVSAAVCVSASAKASRANLVIRSTRKKERRHRSFLIQPVLIFCCFNYRPYYFISLYGFFFVTQPGLFTCFARAIESAFSGTSSVMVLPAAVKA